MGFFGRLFGKKESQPAESQGVNPDMASQDPFAQQTSQGQFSQNQEFLQDGGLSGGLQGVSNDGMNPPSFDDDFTRNNFSEGQGQSGFSAQGPPVGSQQQPSHDNPMGNDSKGAGMEVREMPTEAEKLQQGGQKQNGGKDNLEKDLEIISSKLDALKSAVENIDQRVRRIEKIAEDSNSPHHKPPRW